LGFEVHLVANNGDRACQVSQWNRFPLALTLAFFWPSSVMAKASPEVLHSLGSGFGKFTPFGLAMCGVSLIVILAIIVVWEILRTDKTQREKIDIGWHYFSEMAIQKRLTPQETDLLRRIVESGAVSSADMVFDSSFIYEDAIESFLKLNSIKLDKDESQYALMRGLRVKLGYTQLPSEIPISSTRQFEDGMLITLTDGEEQIVKGRILEVKEKNWIVQMESEIPPMVAVGAAIDISILRSGDGEYTTRLVVLATRLGTRIIQLPHTRNMERKQMRNWVRIDVNIPCRVTVMAKPEDWKAGMPGITGPSMGMVLEGRLIDLSGGGACARFSSPIPQGHKLSLNFDLPGTSLRGVQTSVMRMTSVVRSNREDFEHNLKFMTVETAAQEKIVRYVFEKQRIDSQMRGPIKID
jgi:c-di-GMP-binding flagellar brake protein YcgR